MSFVFGEALVGRHLPGNDLRRILSQADHGIHACQIMGASVPECEIVEVKGHLQLQKVFCVVHGDYTYNFARSNVDHQVNRAIEEYRFADKIGCDLIIHQGKNVAEERLTKIEAIENYVRNVKSILDAMTTCRQRILLENSAHQGTELGYSLSELAYIWRQFGDYKSRLGICLDTCHAFVAGDVDFRDLGSTVAYFERFDRLIGIDNIKVIHYNDSKAKYDAHNDHHDVLGQGYIGNQTLGGSLDGLYYIGSLATTKNIPLILEM